MTDVDQQTGEVMQAYSKNLFDKHETDDAVIEYLNSSQPWWYGVFDFANTLKVLRPSLSVCCVEDPALREQMKPIADAYMLADFEAAPHPSPEHPRLGDHPLNLAREKAIIDNLLALWDSTSPNLASVLNTGLDHSLRIAASLKHRGINYIYISIPPSPPVFQS
jgi:hypothetical protein